MRTNLTFCSIFAVFCCISFHIQAQSPSLCRQVISAAGESAKRQNVSYDYTIGEAVVSTFQLSGTSLTQGFQQPDECTVVTLSSALDNSFSVLVYPNPTMDVLHFQFEGVLPAEAVRISVVDAAGKFVSTQDKNTFDFSDIDCSTLQAGSYFLIFQNEKGQQLGSYAFIKI